MKTLEERIMSWHAPPMVITVSAESDRGPALTGNEHDDNSQFNLTVGFLQSTFLVWCLISWLRIRFQFPTLIFVDSWFLFSHAFSICAPLLLLGLHNGIDSLSDWKFFSESPRIVMCTQFQCARENIPKWWNIPTMRKKEQVHQRSLLPRKSFPARTIPTLVAWPKETTTTLRYCISGTKKKNRYSFAIIVLIQYFKERCYVGTIESSNPQFLSMNPFKAIEHAIALIELELEWGSHVNKAAVYIMERKMKEPWDLSQSMRHDYGQRLPPWNEVIRLLPVHGW